MSIRIIQVGMGDWGRNWYQNVLSGSTDVSVVACVDNDPTMLALAQQTYEVADQIARNGQSAAYAAGHTAGATAVALQIVQLTPLCAVKKAHGFLRAFEFTSPRPNLSNNPQTGAPPAFS